MSEEAAIVDWSEWLREVGNFTMLPNALIQHSGLSSGAFHVLCVVHSHRNRRTGDCMPSRSRIREEMEHQVERGGGTASRRPSLDQLDRYKDELRTHGYMDWERRDGRNYYQMMVPPRIVALMRRKVEDVREKKEPTKRASTRKADIDAMLQHFCGVHLQQLRDAYVPNQSRDRKIIADLLDTMSGADLKDVVMGFFLIDDDWVQREGYSWPTLRAKLPKIQAKLREVVGTGDVSAANHEAVVEEARRDGANTDEAGLVKIGRSG